MRKRLGRSRTAALLAVGCFGAALAAAYGIGRMSTTWRESFPTVELRNLSSMLRDTDMVVVTEPAGELPPITGLSDAPRRYVCAAAQSSYNRYLGIAVASAIGVDVTEAVTGIPVEARIYDFATGRLTHTYRGKVDWDSAFGVQVTWDIREAVEPGAGEPVPTNRVLMLEVSIAPSKERASQSLVFTPEFYEYK